MKRPYKLLGLLASLLLAFPAFGAIAFQALETPWHSGTSPATSGTFSPAAAGDALLVNALNTGNTTAISFSGTGTYNTPVNASINGAADAGLTYNGSATAGSQTVTITASGGNMFGWVMDYSGVSTVTCTNVARVTPGTGSGAILGTSVSVPTGDVLVAFFNDAVNTTAITAFTSGTNRGASTLGATYYLIMEYAGAGAAIQPAATSTAGAADSFGVGQCLFTPPASGAPASQFFLGASLLPRGVDLASFAH